MIALVVEDSATIRSLVVMALNRTGDFHCMEAENGVEALKLLKEYSFDIILTDINMPRMDGLKLLDMVRRDGKYDHLPVIVITTESAAEDRRRAMELGADAYLVKPVRAADITATVTRLIRREN